MKPFDTTVEITNEEFVFFNNHVLSEDIKERLCLIGYYRFTL